MRAAAVAHRIVLAAQVGEKKEVSAAAHPAIMVQRRMQTRAAAAEGQEVYPMPPARVLTAFLSSGGAKVKP